MAVSHYRIRAVREADLDGFFALSELTGTGFTSLQPDREFLARMIAKSVQSFQTPDPDKSQSFLLVMEEAQSGELVGCASVKTGVGGENFKCADFELIGSDGLAVSEVDEAISLRVARTLTGLTEVGSLFLHPGHRASGAGRFLARARYLLMSTRPDVFYKPVVAQLRGVCDQAGNSPFYDAIWSERLGASYGRTDILLARYGAGYLLDGYEGLDVSVNALSEAARQTIGQPHETAAGALRLLYQEGFRSSRMVDLSDGGPIVLADPDQLTSAKSAMPVELLPTEKPLTVHNGMLVSPVFSDFRAAIAPMIPLGEDEVGCPDDCADFVSAGTTSVRPLFSAYAPAAGTNAAIHRDRSSERRSLHV